MAQALADHVLLLLAAGIALFVVALVAVVAAVKLARRHQEPLLRAWTWSFRRARLIPVVGPWLQGARAIVSRALLLHLVLGLIATAAAIAFLIVAEEVFAGREVAQFDLAFARALRDSASPGWEQLFVGITELGSPAVLGTASAIVAIALLVRRAHVFAVGWIIAQAGGGLLVLTLKGAFERSRPEAADAALLASGWSFPSGHAMSTFVFCGLGAYLLLRSTRSTTMTVVAILTALTWCVVMGFSRLYLGVHYVSDVGAGLIAAAAWVAVCISGIELGLRRRATP